MKGKNKMLISEQQLRDSMPGITNKNVVKYLPQLQKHLPKYGIDTPIRIAHFIAQVGHESLDFFYYREISSGNQYDTRTDLGNTPQIDGDGAKYKGRGAIQITGKDNYRKVSLFIFGDERLLEQPELLELPEYGVLAACWFWQSRGLNVIADQNNIIKITKKINGGTNGLQDRIKRLERAKKALGIK